MMLLKRKNEEEGLLLLFFAIFSPLQKQSVKTDDVETKILSASAFHHLM